MNKVKLYLIYCCRGYLEHKAVNYALHCQLFPDRWVITYISNNCMFILSTYRIYSQTLTLPWSNFPNHLDLQYLMTIRFIISGNSLNCRKSTYNCHCCGQEKLKIETCQAHCYACQPVTLLDVLLAYACHKISNTNSFQGFSHLVSKLARQKNLSLLMCHKVSICTMVFSDFVYKF